MAVQVVCLMWEDCPQAAHDSRRKPAHQSTHRFPHLKGYGFFQHRPWTDPYRKGPSLFRPGPSSQIVAKLFLAPRFPRACRRPIAFTDTLAALVIPPLDETGSQVGAPAIAANQLVRFRLTILLFSERSCRRGLSRAAFFRTALLTAERGVPTRFCSAENRERPTANSCPLSFGNFAWSII
jgi:hypothetical protein